MSDRRLYGIVPGVALLELGDDDEGFAMLQTFTFQGDGPPMVSAIPLSEEQVHLLNEACEDILSRKGKLE